LTVLDASFGSPFPEQLAALRLRFRHLVPTARWDDLQKSAHDRAFMVAGAMKADLLADLATAVDKAMFEHRSLKTFREEYLATAKTNGWNGWTGQGTAKGEAWRARVIYKTNMATSYAAGRIAQLEAGGFKFWVYKHGNAREPRLQHLAWDGLALPPDHPFWQTHAPPNGWGCTCRIRGADTRAGILRAKGDPDKKLPDGWQTPDPKTGAPRGIDKGWDYAPGRSVAETVSLAAKKISSLPAEIGSSYGTGLQGIIERAWPTWVADTMVRGSHEPGLAGVMSRALISAAEAKGVAPTSAEMMIKPGLLIGPKADRHSNAGDALTAKQWLLLPQLLKHPKAVLLDRKTGNLILMIDGDDANGQLALALDYAVKKPKSVVNLVVSAYRPNQDSLRGRVNAGLLDLILGSLG
jgi:hypothetical protein